MPYASKTRPAPPRFSKTSFQERRDNRIGRGGGKRLTGSWLGRILPQREMRSRLVIVVGLSGAKDRNEPSQASVESAQTSESLAQKLELQTHSEVIDAATYKVLAKNSMAIVIADWQRVTN